MSSPKPQFRTGEITNAALLELLAAALLVLNERRVELASLRADILRMLDLPEGQARDGEWRLKAQRTLRGLGRDLMFRVKLELGED